MKIVVFGFEKDIVTLKRVISMAQIIICGKVEEIETLNVVYVFKKVGTMKTEKEFQCEGSKACLVKVLLCFHC